MGKFKENLSSAYFEIKNRFLNGCQRHFGLWLRWSVYYFCLYPQNHQSSCEFYFILVPQTYYNIVPYAVNTSINVFLLASCYLRWSIVNPHVCHQCKAKALSVQLSCFRRKCVSQQRRLDNGRGGATTSPFLRFGWQILWSYGSAEDLALRFSHYQCNKILVTLFQP